MARRGRKRRLDTETLYWQLVQSGVGTVEACRLAGIGRKTGYRWLKGSRTMSRPLNCGVRACW